MPKKVKDTWKKGSKARGRAPVKASKVVPKRARKRLTPTPEEAPLAPEVDPGVVEQPEVPPSEQSQG